MNNHPVVEFLSRLVRLMWLTDSSVNSGEPPKKVLSGYSRLSELVVIKEKKVKIGLLLKGN